jgi:hypothetical protein
MSDTPEVTPEDTPEDLKKKLDKLKPKKKLDIVDGLLDGAKSYEGKLVDDRLSELLQILPGASTEYVDDIRASMYLKNGDDWTDTCDIGLAQSPINIETGSFPVIGSFENYEVS